MNVQGVTGSVGNESDNDDSLFEQSTVIKPPVATSDSLSRRDSESSSVDIISSAPIRQRLAHTMGLSQRFADDVFDDPSLTSTRQRALQARLLQVISFGLLFLAIMLFVVLLAVDNGGLDDFQATLLTGEAAVLALAISGSLVPITFVVFAISIRACKPKQAEIPKTIIPPVIIHSKTNLALGSDIC